jgi:hypothetical protein
VYSGCIVGVSSAAPPPSSTPPTPCNLPLTLTHSSTTPHHTTPHQGCLQLVATRRAAVPKAHVLRMHGPRPAAALGLDSHPVTVLRAALEVVQLLRHCCSSSTASFLHHCCSSTAFPFFAGTSLSSCYCTHTAHAIVLTLLMLLYSHCPCYCTHTAHAIVLTLPMLLYSHCSCYCTHTAHAIVLTLLMLLYSHCSCYCTHTAHAIVFTLLILTLYSHCSYSHCTHPLSSAHRWPRSFLVRLKSRVG